MRIAPRAAYFLTRLPSALASTRRAECRHECFRCTDRREPLEELPARGRNSSCSQSKSRRRGGRERWATFTWTFIEFGVEDQDLADLVEGLCRSLDPAGGWYCDFRTPEETSSRRRQNTRGERGRRVPTWQWRRCAALKERSPRLTWIRTGSGAKQYNQPMADWTWRDGSGGPHAHYPNRPISPSTPWQEASGSWVSCGSVGPCRPFSSVSG